MLIYKSKIKSNFYFLLPHIRQTSNKYCIFFCFLVFWEISYTIRSVQYSGEHNYAWLYINGEEIAESYHETAYDGSGGSVRSLGSRSLYMRLESGDTISLRTGAGLGYITLCFELAQFDGVPPM